jgi:hypothetical protein
VKRPRNKCLHNYLLDVASNPATKCCDNIRKVAEVCKLSIVNSE